MKVDHAKEGILVVSQNLCPFSSGYVEDIFRVIFDCPLSSCSSVAWSEILSYLILFDHWSIFQFVQLKFVPWLRFSFLLYWSSLSVAQALPWFV